MTSTQPEDLETTQPGNLEKPEGPEQPEDSEDKEKDDKGGEDEGDVLEKPLDVEEKAAMLNKILDNLETQCRKKLEERKEKKLMRDAFVYELGLEEEETEEDIEIVSVQVNVVVRNKRKRIMLEMNRISNIE